MESTSAISTVVFVFLRSSHRIGDVMSLGASTAVAT